MCNSVFGTLTCQVFRKKNCGCKNSNVDYCTKIKNYHRLQAALKKCTDLYLFFLFYIEYQSDLFCSLITGYPSLKFFEPMKIEKFT
jgi:hypothetical protein